MINASVLRKNSNDEHLNVFLQYNGKPEVENNITKALINVFDSLADAEKKDFLAKAMDINLPEEVTYSYYLQKTPNKDLIEQIPEERKILFAFSPTGKSWGNDGIDAGNIDSIRDSIRKSFQDFYPTKTSDEIGKLTDDQLIKTLNIINNRGNSIPDAWIIIYVGEKPYFCVAFENKLYDLDPYQLNNHCKKSLNMKDNNIKYCSYEKILEIIQKYDGYLIGEFLRYMYYLKYWKIDNLTQLKEMDDERVSFYAAEYCKNLLKKIGKREIEWHKGWGNKFNTDNDFNKMVGLRYNEKKRFFEIYLYFGSTQTSAKALYGHIRDNGYISCDKIKFSNSFHFQYKGTGKNIPETYYDDPAFNIDSYINFWIKNIDSIYQMDKEERHSLLDKMKNEGIIPISKYKHICDFSDNYGKKLNVCPEFGVFLSWNLEDAMELDFNSCLAETMKKRIEDVYKLFHIDINKI